MFRHKWKQPPELIYKKVALKNFTYSQGKKAPMLESLFNKYPKDCNNIKKETGTQVFSCEYCQNFKKAYFEENLQAAAST